MIALENEYSPETQIKKKISIMCLKIEIGAYPDN